MPARLTKVDPATCVALASDDICCYIGEYTSHGGFAASETNDNISNIKKDEPVPDNQKRWVRISIRYWGRALAEAIALPQVAGRVTFIPVPCSKPVGHPEYHDRMLQVVQHMASFHAGIDVRAVIRTSVARQRQHTDGRLTIQQLYDSMEVDDALLVPPLHPTVAIVDDVFTLGRTFKAVQSRIRGLPGVEQVVGIFLARSVWPQTPTDDVELDPGG